MNTLRVLTAAIAALAAGPAAASFHFMQIEQAIGGVAGDVSQQAVQLRMRSAGQNQLQFSRLRVFDANGLNPVLLFDFAVPVTNAALGDRVLVASAAFAAAQGVVPDAVMGAAIPPAYFAGGRLTFEGDGGDVLYSLCWGSYAASTAGSTLNDPDGVYGPCEPGPLPSSNLSALRFDGAASASGTSNAADFSLTAAPAVFTNNARASAALTAPPGAARGGDCNDADPAIHPGLAEVAGNRRDDDCDGLADEDATGLPSMDGDDLDMDGVSLAAGDCDDQDTSIRTGAAEVIGDRKDNDCDRRADEDGADVGSADGYDHDLDSYGMFDRVFISGFEE
jgi:hypothetical protein